MKVAIIPLLLDVGCIEALLYITSSATYGFQQMAFHKWLLRGWNGSSGRTLNNMWVTAMSLHQDDDRTKNKRPLLWKKHLWAYFMPSKSLEISRIFQMLLENYEITYNKTNWTYFQLWLFFQTNHHWSSEYSQNGCRWRICGCGARSGADNRTPEQWRSWSSLDSQKVGEGS